MYRALDSHGWWSMRRILLTRALSGQMLALFTHEFEGVGMVDCCTNSASLYLVRSQGNQKEESLRRDGSRGFGLEHFGTDEHIVTEPGGGVVRARSAKSHVEQWDRDLLTALLDGRVS